MATAGQTDCQAHHAKWSCSDLCPSRPSLQISHEKKGSWRWRRPESLPPSSTGLSTSRPSVHPLLSTNRLLDLVSEMVKSEKERRSRAHVRTVGQEDDVSEPAAAAPTQEEARSVVAEAVDDAVVEANGAREDANRPRVEGNLQGFSIGLIAPMATSLAQSAHE